MVKMATKKEYIQTVRIRYLLSKNRKEKTNIIDEVVANLSKNRKHVIKILSGRYYKNSRRRLSTRPPTYTYELNVPLVKIWEIANKPCSKNLKPQIPELIKVLKKFNEIDISPRNEILLCKMGTSTIDRLLNVQRYKNKLRGIAGTKRSPLLKILIPIRTNFDDIKEMGHVEQDCVLHCGSSLSGEYAETLNTLDIHTHWSEQQAFLHSTKRKIIGAFDIQRHRFPFPIKSTDFDNGSEFVNKGYYAYCKKENIEFTRSRPYKKNDQAHIEGKNYHTIRKVFGYERIEDRDIVDHLNEIYTTEFRLLNNFFYATQKLEAKQRIGGKVKKKYGKAKTPYQRVLDSKNIDVKIKMKLMIEYSKLNPAQLQRNLHIKLTKLNEMISVSKLNHATTPIKR